MLSPQRHAITVTGPVPADQLGVVMMHEHVLHDDVEEPSLMEPLPGSAGERLRDAPMSMELLGTLWRWPLANRENTRLTERDGIADELARYRLAGGTTVVEASTVGFHPDPAGLRRIAEASGIQIVSGCGYFVGSVLPEGFDDRSTEELASELIRDIRVGMGDTGVKAGLIGEVGTSPQLTAREAKSLRASGIAAAETGACVSVHLSFTVSPHTEAGNASEAAFQAIEILGSEGVPAGRVVCCHLDEAQNVELALRLIDRGCVVGYDTFGTEWYWDHWKTWEPHDSHRVFEVAQLCRRGHHQSIVLSQDVAFKRHLHRFGGLGYDHLLTSIVPMLLDAGVTREQLEQMLVATPRRLLTFPGSAEDDVTPEPRRG